MLQRHGSTASLALEEGELAQDPDTQATSRAVGLFASRLAGVAHSSQAAGGKPFCPVSPAPYAQAGLWSRSYTSSQSEPQFLRAPLNTVSSDNCSELAVEMTAESQLRTPPSQALPPGYMKESSSAHLCYDSASDSDDDTPLDIVCRGPRFARSLPILPDTSAELSASQHAGPASQIPTAVSSSQMLTSESTQKSQAATAFSSAPSSSQSLVANNKYSQDVDWINPCQRCIKKGERCFTKAGTGSQRKRCNECVLRHRICIVDGENVAGEEPELEPKRKPKSRSKSRPKSRPTTITKVVAAPRRSRRQPAQAKHAPVVLTAAKKSRARLRERRTKAERKKPTVQAISGSLEEDDELTDFSTISSPPRSDEGAPPAGALEQAPAPTSQRPAEPQPSHPKKVLEPIRPCPDGNDLPTHAEAVKTPAEAAGLPAMTNEAANQAEAQRVEKYAVGLIKDIASAIRRCQERVTRMSETVGLMVLETTLDVLVSEISKLSFERELDTSNPAHWVVPQLAVYLQRIRLECQAAHQTPESREISEDEKKAKQVAAILASETLFDRCLTLISMHVGESSN